MEFKLPKTIVKASRKSPKNMVIYGPPKIGKTTMLSKLDNCLIIDLEDGSDMVDALKVKVNSLAELANLGREIRKAIRPQKSNWKLMSADYSQIELRVMAHLSGEKALVKAFQNDEDIHSRTASLVFKVPVEDVTKDQRRTAKVVNFGIMYGAGPFRMSQELGISIPEARKLIDNYFFTYPGIKNFIDTTLENAKINGYVQTIHGRKRKTRFLDSGNRQQIQAESRVITNMPIQGTAAELIKLAMINIYNCLEEKQLKSKMILQVHDELIFEYPEEEGEILREIIVKEMESAMELNVPLKVDVGTGNHWFDAH